MSKKKAGIIAAIAAGVLLLGGAAVAVPLILKNANTPSSEESESVAESSSEVTTEEVTYPEGITWYDVNDEVVEISTVQQLLDLAELSFYFDFEGQTLKLMNDLTLNEGNAEDWKEERPEVSFKPIRNFAGTFDGQGHTISGIYLSGGDMRLAMFSSAKDTAVIENLSVVNSYIKSNGSMGTATFASNSGGTFRRLYSNAVIEVSGGYVAGISAVPTDSTYEECWFDGTITSTTRYAGGIVDVVPGYKTVSVKHCLNTSTINNTWTRNSSSIGGIVGCVQGYSTLYLDDCFSDGVYNFSNYIRCGSIIGGDANNGTSSSYVSNAFATSDNFATSISGVQTGIVGGAIALKSAKLVGDGGYEWTLLDFDNYWTTVPDTTPRLLCFTETKGTYDGLAKHFDTSWYDEAKDEFLIHNLEEFYGFAMLSFSTKFEGKTVKLANDIEMNENPDEYLAWAENMPDNPWIPIGNTAFPFSGVFDGDGHTISGMYLDGGGMFGLFGVTSETSEVGNFSLTKSYFHAQGSTVGFVAGRGNGYYHDIYCDGTLVLDVPNGTAANGIGGLIGQVQMGTARIENCWFDGSMTVEGDGVQQCGGILGHVTNSAGVEIRHCLNTGSITGNRNGGYNNLGGIIGLVNDRSLLVLEDSLGVGTINPKGNTGGCGSVVGHVGLNADATISDSYAVKEAFSKALGVNRGSVNGGIEMLTKADMSGYKSFQWTNLNFEDYWAVVLNDTPILASFAENPPSLEGYKKMFDTSWYDPEGTSFVIRTREELYGFLKLSYKYDFEGQTISLGNSIAINSGSAVSWANGAVPAMSWGGISDKSKPFKGTFDGRYQTVSGIYLKETDECKGFFNVTANPAIVKNLRITNSYFECAAGAVASAAGRGNGTFSCIYSDAIIRSTAKSAQGCGGIVGQVQENNSTNSVSYCWFNGQLIMTGDNAQQNGGIVGKQFYQSNLTIAHCLFTGYIYDHRASGFCNIGGIMGFIQPVTTGGVTYYPACTIYDCLSDGKLDTVTGGVGSILGQAGANSVMTIRNCYGSADTKSTTVGANNIKVPGAYNDSSATLAVAKLKGTEAYKWTDLDFRSVWGCVADSTPRLRAFTAASNFLDTSAVAKVDTSWYDKNATEYVINTLSEFISLQVIAASDDFSGKTIKFGNDIVFNENHADYLTWGETAPENEWTPIASSAKPFQGTIDGQGHTLSGLYVNTNAAFTGLITESKNATIKNLKVVDSYIASTEGRTATFIGRGGCTFENVYTNAYVKGIQWTGGFIGQGTWTDSAFTNCEFAGKIEAVADASRYTGGFLGSVNGNAGQNINVTVSHSKFSGEINVTRTTEGAADVGGVIGQIVSNAGAVCKLTVSDFLSAGSIHATAGSTQVGSVIGAIGSGQSAVLDTTYAVTGSAFAGETPVEAIGNAGTREGSVSEKEKTFLLGLKGYNNTLLDFDTYWAALEGETPILQAFAGEGQELIDVSGVERFDETWYDASATEYHVSTRAQLLRLVEAAKGSEEEPAQNFAGKTIYLDEDIIFNEGHENFANWATEAPEKVWEGLGLQSGSALEEDRKFQGTIDGQLHKIYGLYQVISEEDGMTGLVPQMGENAAIKNLFIVNSYFENSKDQMNGSVAGIAAGTIDTVYSNAIVKATLTNLGGMVGQISDTLTMNKVWFAGSVVGVEGTKIGRRAGGIVGSVPKDSKLILSNALYTGSTEVLPVSSTNYAGGLVGQITGTNSAADISESLAMGTVVVADKYNGQIAGQIGAQAKVNVDKVYAVTEGKAVGTGTPTGTIEIVTADAIKGEAAREALSLAFDTIWITVEGSAPEINDLSEHRIPLPTEPDTEWYDAGASEYTISTINELYGLAELAKKDQFKGKTIKIAADIVLNEDHANFAEWGTTAPTYEWIPMGATEYVANNTNGFSGTIDGQGHTIYGLYSKQAADLRGGLFNTLTNATIKNLKLTNCYFENALNAQRFGGFAGVACGTTFENVYTNAIVKNTTSANHVAGFVGQGWGVTFRNCWFDGEVSNEGSNGTSGFLGTCTEAAALVYENCLYTGKITVTKEDARAGAFIGYAFYHTRNLTFTNCLSAGSITGPGALANAGSFSGLFNNGTDGVITAAYTNCYAVTGSATSGKTIVLPESTTSVVTGSVTEVAKNDITGEAAKTTLAGFDFDSVWTAVTEGEGSTPVLTSLQ